MGQNKKTMLINYAAMEPMKMLERYSCRYTFFMERKHNSFDEFTVIYDQDTHTIIFSDQLNLTPAQLKKFATVFCRIANGKYMDGKQQDKRFDIVANAFGKDGIDTALDIFKQTHVKY